MFKLFLVYRPQPGIEAGAFHKAWIARRRAEANDPAGDIHRLALRHAYSAGIPQEGALAPTGHAWEPRWTGIEELWFADETQARAAAASPACNPLLLENDLVDPADSHCLVAREAPNVGGPYTGANVKSFLFIRRLPRLSQEVFFHHWTVIHPPVWAMVRAATQHLPPPKTVKTYFDEALNDGTRPIGYDSVAEGWHNSVEEMAAPFQTPEHDEHVLADADLFREITRDILATEHVLYDRRDMPLQAVG
jgi:hypothetical protein